MADRELFESFQAWLEDHNYCRVHPCDQCFFWGSAADKRYQEPARHCRRHNVLTYPDDYCNYFVANKISLKLISQINETEDINNAGD